MDRGLLVPLKTTLELDSCEKLVSVWIVGVEAKNASGTLSLVRNLLPGDETLAFQHLKRFARLSEVPEDVRNAFKGAIANTLIENCSTNQNEASFINHSDKPPALEPKYPTPRIIEENFLLLVVCPVIALSYDKLKTVLSTLDENFLPTIIATSVPLLAPTSAAQASRWTATHWPTVYKKNNPFGPHPSIISRAQAEIEKDAQQWIELARNVAAESGECDKGLRRGEAIGVVIVERKQGMGEVVAVAGDARWVGWGREKISTGNPTAHAVMRAIAMVATSIQARHIKTKGLKAVEESLSCDGYPKPFEQSDSGVRTSHEVGATIETESSKKELRTRKTSPSRSYPPEYRCADITPKDSYKSIFHDKPLSPQEAYYLDLSGNQSGYLCHNLEIYCTHEPCVMCSMALVHSRFGRVVFETPMFYTGGLTADGFLGHGLFWRKELNWTILAWQLQRPVADQAVVESFIHA